MAFSSWLLRINWPTTYGSCRQDVLFRRTQLPVNARRRSSTEDGRHEDMLAFLLRGVITMLDRCEETVSSRTTIPSLCGGARKGTRVTLAPCTPDSRGRPSRGCLTLLAIYLRRPAQRPVTSERVTCYTRAPNLPWLELNAVSVSCSSTGYFRPLLARSPT